MGLVSKYVEVGLNGKNIPYYEKIGYKIPRHKNKYGRTSVKCGTKIRVKVNDLLKCSTVYVDVECDNCGKIYPKKYVDYLYSLNSKGRIYCLKCSRPSGENHHKYNKNISDDERIEKRHYQEYIDFTKRVLARDNYACQNCGKKSIGDIVVHHLDSYDWCIEGRTDDTNGITLCVDCHKNFHQTYGYGNNTKKQFEEWSHNKLEKLEKYNGVLPSRKKVYCFEKNKIYKNSDEAAIDLNCTSGCIKMVCNPKVNVFKVHGFHCVWYDDYIKMSKDDIDSLLSKGHVYYKDKRVICLNTNEILEKDEACNKYNISIDNLYNACNKNGYCGVSEDGTHLIWMYYEKYKSKTRDEIDIILKKEYSRQKRVICININKIFDSIRSASKCLKMSRKNITKCCKGEIKTYGKLADGTPLEWMYYDDFLKLSIDKQNEILNKNKEPSSDGSFLFDKEVI